MTTWHGERSTEGQESGESGSSIRYLVFFDGQPVVLIESNAILSPEPDPHDMRVPDGKALYVGVRGSLARTTSPVVCHEYGVLPVVTARSLATVLTRPTGTERTAPIGTFRPTCGAQKGEILGSRLAALSSYQLSNSHRNSDGRRQIWCALVW